MSKYDYAKLRPISVNYFMHQGEPMFHLRDPMELSPSLNVVPGFFGVVLNLCDGKHTLSQMHTEIKDEYGPVLSEQDIERILTNLDSYYVLDNLHAKEAKRKALASFRRKPYRQPASAGASYAAKPATLRRQLQAFVDQVEPLPLLDEGVGLISPHIDYARGGPVYARAWQHAAKLAQQAECVIVLGTDHSSPLPSQITPTRQNYATPFGTLPTEQAVVSALVDVLGEQDAFAEELHHRQEWSIELVLTWLHFMRAGEPCPVVPILCGNLDHHILTNTKPADEAKLQDVVEAIKTSTAGKRTLVVASGDLAHLGPAFEGQPITCEGKEQIKVDDDEMLVPLLAGDGDAFFENIRQHRSRRNVCGTAPFYLALKLMGEVQGELTAYDRCLADDEGTSFVSVCGMTFR